MRRLLDLPALAAPSALVFLAACEAGPECPETQYLKDGLCLSPDTGAARDTGTTDDTVDTGETDDTVGTGDSQETDSGGDTEDSEDSAGSGDPDEGGGGGYEELPDEEGTGAGDDGWRPSASITLSCTWLSQVPPGDWTNTKNCGPTSLVMANACLTGTTPDYGDIIDVIEWMDDNISTYAGVGSDYNGDYTSTEELRQTSEGLYGRAAERFSGVSLSTLWTELASGRPVIVAIEDQYPGNDEPSDVMIDGTGHFALLVGMTPTHVILHDPGRSQATNGEFRDFTIDSFYEHWQDAGVTFAATTTCGDADGDGYDDDACGGSDCDDADSSVSPGAAEGCNSIDDDCDGVVDDGVTYTDWYPDDDGDSYGDDDGSVSYCDGPAGYVSNGGDCDDGDSGVHPGAAEQCNSEDDDCDGTADDGVSYDYWYDDNDHDGYGDDATETYDCEAPAAFVAVGGDCDDSDANVHPGATEQCNSEDDDCDGTPDESVSYDYWYDDNDGDGYGDDSTETYDCEAPAGYVGDGGDCDDSDSAIHPGASEACNSMDDDCDGSTDEGVGYSYYYSDADSDGYGAGAGTYDCAAPSGYVSNADDCDDSDSGINPGASEACDGEDENCNSEIDDASACWTAIYRFEDSATGARCWNTSTSAPSTCSGYTLEIEAWIVPSTSVPDTFHAVQCSNGTDHIIVEDGSADETALRGAGYDCSLSLGYPYELGSGPTSGTTPYAYTCDVWRFSYSTSGGGAHLFTRGADSVSSMTCEDPARFEVVTDESCFSSTPSGC